VIGSKVALPLGTRHAEASMTNIEIKALENAGRTTAVWTEGYDGQTHYGDVFRALAPALLILVTAAGLMLALF
jgi:hypothetical protein